jgi:uncharacterized repeat protein (TIGR01451 family)
MRESGGTGPTARRGVRLSRFAGLAIGLVVLIGITAGSSLAKPTGKSSVRHLAASPGLTAKQHEGQRSDGTYTSGNITQYKEGDTINFRFTLSASGAASGQLQVRFTGDDGTCLFFDNYFVLQPSPGVSVATGPTADSFGTSNGEWVVALNINASAAGEQVVNYQLKLSNEAGDCSGSSQHSRLNAGDGVSQTGQQNVPVPANQIIELPSITVTKLVDRGTGTFVPANAGEYCFTMDSGTCAAVDSNGQAVFTAASDGPHTITESNNLQSSGYTFDSGTGTNCTFNGSTATATVAAGTTATNASCTFKNKLTAPPKVTITKSCPNGAANASDRFQVQLNGSNVGTALACGGGIDVNPTAGQSYSITEAAAGTTDFNNYTSSLSAGCSGTLSFGGTATCTITNSRKALPKVMVTKSCPNGPANPADRFQGQLNGQNAGAALACGDSVDVNPTVGQAYSITEVAAGTTDLSNYTSSLGAGCSGTLAHFGDTASCTITNTLKAAPKVTVTKSCPNGKPDAGDRFQARLDGQDSGDPLDCGDSTDMSVAVGQAYEITEAAAGTADLANYENPGYSAGCTGTLLHFGDTATCTITNTLQAAPKVTVTKSCPEGKANAGDRFQVRLDGQDSGDPLDCGDSTAVSVTAGEAYSITEAAAGTADLANYTTTLSEGCAGTLSHFGDAASCTITNTLKAAPKLTVIKHVINDNGGTKHAADFTLTVSGTTPSPASFQGNEAGTEVTLKPGPYAVNEAAASGYSTTKSEGCSGSLIHYGDTATCTVTNNDIASPPPPPPPAGVPEIDLAITKTDSPDPVSVGGLLTYTLTVTNKKGDTANSVVVTDALPSGVTLVSVSTTKGTCSGSNPISCAIGSVAYNELVTIMVVVRPSSPGMITNTAVVTGREHEHDASDNTASAATLVQGAFQPPSVCYALTVTPRSLTVGKHTIMRVRVREAGKPVKGVRVVVSGRRVNMQVRTNANGIARFVITARTPGILQIRVPSHSTCTRQRMGVLGAFTPPVTG